MPRFAGWLMSFLGSGFAVWRGAAAVRSLREWLRWKESDPSGAELYGLAVWFNLVLVVVGIIMAVGGVLILRRQRRSTEIAEIN